MSEKFQALLAELDQAGADTQEQLAKSLPAAVEPQTPAAATPATPAAAATPAAVPANPEDTDGGVLAKALGEVDALAQGTQAATGDEPVVIDGEEIFKSLEALGGRQTGVEEVLTKSVTSLLGLVKGQNTLIKSLSDRLDVLGGTGAGRRTVIQVQERPEVAGVLAKSQPEGMQAGELLAKANAAWDAKKITGQEFTALDVSLRNGQVPSTETLNKILS
jgi:hypothetical protein